MRAPAGGDAPRWLPLAGVALALGAAAWLTYRGLDWQRNGCGCDGALMPAWSWAVLLALAAACYVAGAVLAWRWVRRRR